MRIALVGYGRMGREVEAVAREAGHEIVARIDPGGAPGTRPWPEVSGTTPAGAETVPDADGGEDPAVDCEALAGAEVAVEFTRPDQAVPNIRRIVATGTPVVVGTTGWTDALDEVEAAVEAAGTGLLWAPNFSLGVQVFLRAARALARLTAALPEHDVHLHEAHHRHKLDHPSGTARALAELLVGEVAGKTAWAPGPGDGSVDGPPDPRILRVTSVRAGEIPGTHVVGVDGPDDRIELRHEARSRRGFARGAVAAAEWIRGRRGVHTVDDLLAHRLGNRLGEGPPGSPADP